MASSPSGPVYLDYAATAPMRQEAREAYLRTTTETWGNPSSPHQIGRRARAALEDARGRIATLLGADPREVVFTHGGTQSDNLAILGSAEAQPEGPFLVSAIEHRAVLEAAAFLRRAGRKVHLLPVDAEGRVDHSAIEATLAERPALVSLMWANNETGAVQSLPGIGGDTVLHSDAIQAFGRLPVRVDTTPVHLLSISAHKLGGPRGVGALFIRRGTAIQPLTHGGRQEFGYAAGTEDVAGAVAFAAAAEAAEAERESESIRLAGLRDRLESALDAAIDGLVVHARRADRLPGFSCISIPGSDPDLLLAGLDLEGVMASSGSACSSGSVTPSHVLLAMGVPAPVAAPSLRFSLGLATTEAHIDRVIGVLPSLVERLRSP